MSLTLAIGLVVAALAAVLLLRSMSAPALAPTADGGQQRQGPVTPTFAGLQRDAPVGAVATYSGGLVIDAKSAASIAESNRQAQAGLVASLASWNPENPGFQLGWIAPPSPVAQLSRASAERVANGYVGYYDPASRVKLPGIVDAGGRGYVYSKATLAFAEVDYHRDFVVLILGAADGLRLERASTCAVWDRRTRLFRSTLPPFGCKGTVRFPADRSGVTPVNPLGVIDAYRSSAVYGYYRGGMLGDVKAAEEWWDNVARIFRALRVVRLA